LGLLYEPKAGSHLRNLCPHEGIAERDVAEVERGEEKEDDG
jgi:hypothetical protein